MNLMKNVIRFSFLFALVAFLATATEAQDDKSKRKSPPVETTGMIGDVTVAINYSAPSMRGRTIFGDLEPWGEVWRTGANEATTFEIDKDITVEGETLPAGKYGLFTIPGEETWTVIFNSVWDQWGDYDYDTEKDVLRVEVAPKTLDEAVEQMKFVVKEKDGDTWIALKWANTKVPMKVAPIAAN